MQKKHKIDLLWITIQRLVISKSSKNQFVIFTSHPNTLSPLHLNLD